MRKLLPLFLLLCCLTGCWDQAELNQISLVTGMGLDAGKKHRYRLSVEALNATEYSKGQSEGGSSQSVVVSIEGNSMHEILERIHTKIARELVFSHMQLFAVSEEVARRGFVDVLDWLERSRQARNRLQLVVAKDATAQELLRTTYPIQKVSTFKLRKQIHSASLNWAISPETHLREFVQMLVEPGKEGVLPALTLKGDRTKTGRMEQETLPEPVVTISNLAVFNKEKLVGFLELQDTKSYMWVTNQMNRDQVSVLCKPGSKRSVMARLYDTHAEVKASYRNGRPYFHIYITQEGRIDNTECLQPLAEQKSYAYFNKLLSRHVEQQILSTISLVQRTYKSDIFGFGEHMYRQQYKQFKEIKDWDEAFARAKVTVQVDTNLVRSGIRTNTFIQDIE
ncbi:Ger(x)C family spore germination protein [Ectobacillus ponti]|uniref:Ger(X)C family spore germination protein n=1 Tax=Ectobacillus ponti TaxID=2961894 RepID=A0AA42BSR9_9BACI|nr:Ger(x)C family spore germination protein [Ectobacillus ponti]MCP8970824.1 Ger(x)C family spore germination protein [Ectobacillus ponti]